MSKFKKIVPLFLILTFILVLYRQVIFFDYVWDDDLLIVDNVALVNSSLNWDIIARPVLDATSYFRPLVFLSWFIEFKLFGQSASTSHLINLILFLINIGFVYVLSYFLAINQKIKNIIIVPTLCALLYALHPSHVETTAWVSGRFDLMATFFTLLGCIIFIYTTMYQKVSVTTSFSIALCYFFALLSKEVGLIMPVLLVILYIVVVVGGFKQNLINFFKFNKALFLFICGFFIVYYFLRIFSMQETYHHPLTWKYYQTTLLNDFLPLFAIKQYFLHALFPFNNLGPFQPIDLFIEKNWLNLLSIIITALLLILALVAAYTRKSFLALMLLAYFITISLVIFLIPLSSADNIIQERFMTLGLSFFVIGIVISLAKLEREKIKLISISVILIWAISACLILKSIIPFWKNEVFLWGWVNHEHPDTPIVRNLYYSSLLKHNYVDQLIFDVNQNIFGKNKSLNIADQIIYSRALLTKENPESLQYLKGVTMAIPLYHQDKNILMKDLERLLATQQLTPMIVATAYDSLSIATLWFDNNPKLALEYNLIAERYLDPAEIYPVLFNRVAILKVMGLNDESENLLNEINKINMYRKSENLQNITNIIDKWCQLNRTDNSCKSEE